MRLTAIRTDKGLTIENSTSLSLHGGNLILINLYAVPDFIVSLSHLRDSTVSLETKLLFVKSHAGLLKQTN